MLDCSQDIPQEAKSAAFRSHQLHGCLPSNPARPHLQALDLSDNHFESPPQCLHNGSMVNLQRLDLSHNYLAGFDRPFDCFHALQELNLSLNLLARVPQWLYMGHATCLTDLDLSWNNLSQSPEPARTVAIRLKRLNLRNCRLSSLFLVEHCVALHCLLLGNEPPAEQPSNGGSGGGLKLDNVLSEVRFDRWCCQRTLQELCLSRLQMAALDDSVGCLVALRRLDLSHNRLDWLPDTIAHLCQLQQLNLAHNHLSFLPAQMGQLCQLQRLQLQHNLIATLPPSLRQLRQLEWLDLYENELTNDDVDIINEMMEFRLKMVDLEQNYFETGKIQGYNDKLALLRATTNAKDKRLNGASVQSTANSESDDCEYVGKTFGNILNSCTDYEVEENFTLEEENEEEKLDEIGKLTLAAEEENWDKSDSDPDDDNYNPVAPMYKRTVAMTPTFTPVDRNLCEKCFEDAD